MRPLEMPEGGLEVRLPQRLIGPFDFLFVRFVHVGAPVSANATCVRCGELSVALAGGDSGMRSSVEIDPATDRTRARTVNVDGKGSARVGSPARSDGATNQSIRETAPARVPTVCLMGLSVRFGNTESAAIEDIRSSMPTKENHHERHPTSPLQLHHLSRNRLRLRVPASRLRLRTTVPMRRAMPMCRRDQLRPVLSRIAAGILKMRLDPAPTPKEGTCPWTALSWPMPAASSAPS
ncbi:MAG: hypothetical protein ABI564_11485 [Ideonella sp.]